jgi:hypothetical protein
MGDPVNANRGRGFAAIATRQQQPCAEQLLAAGIRCELRDARELEVLDSTGLRLITARPNSLHTSARPAVSDGVALADTRELALITMGEHLAVTMRARISLRGLLSFGMGVVAHGGGAASTRVRA